MFKKLAFVCLIVFCIFSISAQEKSDREKSGFVGYVKSVREETAEIIIKNGKPVERKREANSLEVFDISGKQISYTFIAGKEDEPLSADTKIYDEKGLLVEVKTKHSPYSYLNDREVYKYDENNKLIEESGYDENGKLNGKRTYRYNSLGQLIEETSEKASEEKRLYYNDYIRKFKYDQNNRKIEEATYKKVGDEWKPEDFRVGFYKQLFFYNSEGKLIAETRISADEKIYQTTVINYDAKGREIESNTFNADGSVKGRTKYTYDEFDKQGNCIKETEYEWVNEDGKSFFQPSETTYYKIEYFTEREIKDFEAKKPVSRTQENKSLQNTDKEEYAVYYTLLEQWIVNQEIKTIVVKKFTDTHSVGDEKPLTIDSFLRPRGENSPLEQSMVDDYNEKNYRQNSELVGDLFGSKSKIVLVSDAEVKEFFNEGCNEGWKKLGEKYPNSQGLTTLSRVGFNKEKTRAVVYLGHSFACLGGAGHLVILEKQYDGWKIVNSTMLWIS
jgi:hypothetical protein